MELKLSFTEQQLEVLNLALIDLPYKLAAPLIQSINDQIKQQLDVLDESKQENLKENIDW